MITDARVLQSEFIPREVQHRDAEVNYLSSVLDPITHGQRADPALLHGPSGAGKTCIAQFLVEQLRGEVVDLNYQYVNCWEDHSRFKALYRLLDGIGQTVDVHRQSTPKDVLLERLRESENTPYVVILDEVDQLEDKSLLYDLYRIPHLTMILICNDEDGLFVSMDDRLNSRLTDCERIRFRSYHESELVAILSDRVRWGLTDGSIDTSCLELIAANAGGDARIAIGILRRAARKAKGEPVDKITADIIHEETPEAKSEIKQRTVDRLTPHQKILYNIITETGKIAPQQLYSAYCNRAEDPKTKRMVRNYLSKLEHYNLITAEGNTKARIYRTRA
ncbi:Cdc6/Cdc18 family protein [Halapricum hydrolyticum]|uniref:Orc1/cdc6 family replication initiation protein n=1 Tax=Halapricum hydrolyticum TaxID=2979991 RepID=A0AAE3IBI7_9EURY|nr:orc1/cdc6 family replication initiation protein [Halapricum hydrolyticum]MCU4717922.1 orc1/cdc6 family replication initiation protein [Halapricum hydrolyticum]MCU4727087.1 orc1/cdc6 family replication initiation protein [Halapricum hydrolyticum]